MKSVNDFAVYKSQRKAISMITCYDYWSANLIKNSAIDAVLVGDSASMVMHGYPSTVHAEIDMMAYHVGAVAKGLAGKFLIADMPFLAHRKGRKYMMNCVDRLIKSGANAVKIEGEAGVEGFIKHVVQSGVPVMGHLGLMPQSYHQIGGFKLQGTSKKHADSIMKAALELEEAGVFALVLEMVPSTLANKISKRLTIPTIGIGAGSGTDGQVLVLQDMLGMSGDFSPKFLRKYLAGGEFITTALNAYDQDVKKRKYPSIKESY